MGMLKYSVLRYVPSVVSGEAINIGMIVVDLESGIRDFYYTKRIKRILDFDDSVVKKNIETLLSSIRFDVTGHLFANSDFDIDEFVRFYCNQYRFDKPQVLKYHVFEEQVEELKKTFFRFDFKKSERPTADDDRKMLRQMLESRFDTVKNHQSVAGTVNETILFDYVAGEYKVKYFDFSNKKIKSMINTIKAWAWNCLEDDKIYIVYRYDPIADAEQRNDFDTIMKVLKKAGHRVCSVENISDSLQYMTV